MGKGEGRWCVPCLEVPLPNHELADLLECHALRLVEPYDPPLVDVPVLCHFDCLRVCCPAVAVISVSVGEG